MNTHQQHYMDLRPVYHFNLPHWLALRLRIAEMLEHIKKNWSDRVIATVVDDFNKNTLYFDNITSSVPFTVEEAKILTVKLKNILAAIQSMDAAIIELSNRELSESFKAFKKAVYNYEANLHTIITENNPVIQTPEYLKQALSSFSKKAVH